MEHTKHLWRAALLILLLAMGLVAGRHFMLPSSFGLNGFYRDDSRAEFMAQKLVHGGRNACASCHEAQQQEHDAGKHAAVSCEVCHAPLSQHAEGDKKIADMPTNPSRQLCELCHGWLTARPKTFPQVVVEDHLIEVGALEKGEPVPDAGCKLCHPAHKPEQEK